MRFSLLLVFLLCQLSQAELVSRQITIHTDGVAVVNETHRFSLDSGSNELQIRDLPADLIRDRTALIPEVGRIVQLELYTPAESPSDLLLEAEGQTVELEMNSGTVYCGQVIKVSMNPGHYGRRGVLDRRVRPMQGSLVLEQTNGKRVVLDLAAISSAVLPEAPVEEESSSAHFTWYSSQRQDASLQLEYIVPRIFGVVSYSAQMDEHFKMVKGTLKGEILLWNYSDTDLKDAELFLSCERSPDSRDGDWFSVNVSRRFGGEADYPPYSVGENWIRDHHISDTESGGPFSLGKLTLEAGAYAAVPLRADMSKLWGSIGHRIPGHRGGHFQNSCELVLMFVSPEPEELLHMPPGFLELSYTRTDGKTRHYRSSRLLFDSKLEVHWFSLGPDKEMHYTRSSSKLPAEEGAEEAPGFRTRWSYTLTSAHDRIRKVYIHEEAGADNPADVIQATNRWVAKPDGFVMDVDVNPGQNISAFWDWKSPRRPESANYPMAPPPFPQF